MKLACAAVFASALLASHAAAQNAVCAPSDGDAIKTWMTACESVAGNSQAKCNDSACHAALHRLEEEETHECWEYLGLGSHHDFDKYVALDAFCHGEGPDPSVAVAPGSPICTESDGFAIVEWMATCEAVSGDNAAKCANSACHAALHHLEEEETHECWEYLGFGLRTDFDKYVALDAFCHGETAKTATANSTAV